MRTTLTLDPDVAAKLKAEALRLGLASRCEAPAARFEVRTRDLGGLRPGPSYDNVEELLDQIEGPLRR
ncbi:MAG TPA: hypothetical protein VF406_06485 [Thermodesulfobacteriota bacterium]